MADNEARPPFPPFTRETAIQKVRMAEDGWNSRDPARVALAYTVDSRWRNRAEFPRGRDQIVEFLTRKWQRELDYRLIKELWAFTENRIAVRFAYEWRDDSGNWFRSYGNENHNHLICTTCGEVWEMKNDDLLPPAQLKKIRKFTVNYYSMYIYGTCSKCTHVKKMKLRRLARQSSKEKSAEDKGGRNITTAGAGGRMDTPGIKEGVQKDKIIGDRIL